MIVEIRAEDAAAHSLPPVGFRFDTGTAPFCGEVFPEPGWYFIGSGPPGGTLTFRIQPSSERESDVVAVERAARAGFAHLLLDSFILVDRGEVHVAGAARPAIAFTEGSSIRKAGFCATLVGAASTSLLITFGHGPLGTAQPTCSELATHPFLRIPLESFTLLI